MAARNVSCRWERDLPAVNAPQAVLLSHMTWTGDESGRQAASVASKATMAAAAAVVNSHTLFEAASTSVPATRELVGAY